MRSSIGVLERYFGFGFDDDMGSFFLLFKGFGRFLGFGRGGIFSEPQFEKDQTTIILRFNDIGRIAFLLQFVQFRFGCDFIF